MFEAISFKIMFVFGTYIAELINNSNMQPICELKNIYLEREETVKIAWL